jgi:hypothetical protein
VNAFRAKIAAGMEEVARTMARLRSLDEYGTADAPLSGRVAIESDLRKSILEEESLRARGFGPTWPALARAHATTERLRTLLAELERNVPTPSAEVTRPLLEKGDLAIADSQASAGRILEALRLKKAPLEVIQVAQALVTSVDYEAAMIQTYQESLAQALSEINRYEKSRALYVTLEPQLTSLEHSRDEVLTEYKQVLGDLRDVEKLVKAEDAGRADHFRTLEAATVPQVPSAPNRLLLLAAALAGAMGLSISLGWAIDQVRRGYASAAELEAHLGLPVLGEIPVLDGPAGARASAQSHEEAHA